MNLQGYLQYVLKHFDILCKYQEALERDLFDIDDIKNLTYEQKLERYTIVKKLLNDDAKFISEILRSPKDFLSNEMNLIITTLLSMSPDSIKEVKSKLLEVISSGNKQQH